MAVQTGRTVAKWVAFLLSDESSMRELAVDNIGPVGLDYPEEDLTAFMDAIRGVLLGIPNFSIEIGGPWDTGANQNHAVLSAAAGKMTPLSVDIQFGIRHDWEAGEPQFGITASATAGVLVASYKATPNDGKFTATLAMIAGSTAPAWGTAAEAVS